MEAECSSKINFVILKRVWLFESLSNVFENGGEGGLELANILLETLDNEISNYSPIYDEKLSIKEKIEIVSKEIYGASDIEYTNDALNQIAQIEKLNLNKLPICIAKTQYSLSDDESLLGTPNNFTIHVKEIKVSAGAGFIVVLTGSILTMPGLPKIPAAEKIDILEDGSLTGIF